MTTQMQLASKVTDFNIIRSPFLITTFPMLVPNLPASRPSNVRQRGEETPSNTGGLSEIARRRLEERRREREQHRGGYTIRYSGTKPY